MRHFAAIMLLIMYMLSASAAAKDSSELSPDDVLPRIRICETTYDELMSITHSGHTAKVYPQQATRYITFADGSEVHLTFRFFSGDYRVTEITVYGTPLFECDPSGIIESASDIVPGCTTLDQLAENADKLCLFDDGTVITDSGESYKAVMIETDGAEFVVWFQLYDSTYICNRIYTVNSTSHMENILSGELTAHTISDFADLKLFESDLDSVTSAYPGWTEDPVELTFTTAPCRSIIYTLADGTHLSLEFMESDGKWILAGICWVPDSADAFGIMPNPDSGKTYSRMPYTEDMHHLSIGRTTYDEVNGRYFDHCSHGTSQDSIDFRLMDANGNSADLFFLNTEEGRVLYAIRRADMFEYNVRPRWYSGK